MTRYGLPEPRIWAIASGAYLGIVVILRTLALLPQSGFPNIPGRREAMAGSIPGVSGLALLIANLWLQSDWPYLTQLLIALTTSFVLYMSFVISAVVREPEQRGN